MRRSTAPTTRWRALPTLLVVLGAIGLGAVTARAEDRPGFPNPNRAQVERGR